MCDALLGSWRLAENNNSADFDKYMEGVGVSFLTRKAACHLKPDVEITKNGDKWCIKTISTFKNTELPFILGEEFDETTADGRKVKCTITEDNGALVQVQKWDDKVSTITRKVEDGQMITTCVFGDVKCVRFYDKK